MNDNSRKIKEYDYKALIQAHLDANRSYYVHPDFKNYYSGLLDALQKVFEIDLKNSPSPLEMLFRSTVRSFDKITHPGSDFLEASALITLLDWAGEKGAAVRSSLRKISTLNKESTQAHLEILYNLFQIMFGEVTKVVTSQDLLALGFDDSKKPDIRNYYDYM